jgi:hypothetical protein
MLKVVVTGYLKKTYSDYCMPGPVAVTRRYLEEMLGNKTHAFRPQIAHPKTSQAASPEVSS